MNLEFTAAAAVLVLTFFSCNNRPSPVAQLNKENNVGVEDQKIDGYYQGIADTTTNVVQTAQQVPPANPDWNKKIIKNGTINLEVKNYSKYYQLLSEIVKREGGYIAQEDQHQSEYKLENNVIIKVPVARFEETMDLVASGTGDDKVKEKKVSSEDVTGEVVDTKSRIEAKKEVRLRYLELLKQAKNMKDILEVQNEINSIQEEMEMAAGRLNYLDHSSAYSTINLSFYEILNASAGEVKEQTFASRIFAAFAGGWTFIKSIIIGVVSIWPVWLVGIAVWLGFRKWKGTKKDPITLP